MTAARWTFYDNFRAFPLSTVHRERATLDIFAEVVVSKACPDGGTEGEFMVRWYEFGGNHGFAPRIEAFADSWRVLHESNLMQVLAGLDNPTPSVFMQALRDASYEDRTEELHANDPGICPTCRSHGFAGADKVTRLREKYDAVAVPS